MHKRTRLQFFIILIVTLLTVYNILPTVFYYAKPLKQSIDAPQAQSIASSILQRVNSLEHSSLEWIKSYCKLLNLSPDRVEINEQSPHYFTVHFAKAAEAALFQKQISRAGSSIPFVPAQLTAVSDTPSSKSVIVLRQIPLHLSEKDPSAYFTFSKKRDSSGAISALYKKMIFDRAAQIAVSLTLWNDSSLLIEQIVSQPFSPLAREQLFALSYDIKNFISVFGEKSPAAKRYFNSLTSPSLSDKEKAYSTLLESYDHFRKQLRIEKSQFLEQTKQAEEEQNELLAETLHQKISLLEGKESILLSAETLFKSKSSLFTSSKKSSWDFETIVSKLQQLASPSSSLTFPLEGKNPFFKSLVIDWANEQILLIPYQEVLELAKGGRENEEKYEQLIINEIAKIKRKTNEEIATDRQQFAIALPKLENSESFLALDLSALVKAEQKAVVDIVKKQWHPRHEELQPSLFPLYDYETYKSLPEEEKAICLVCYAPILEKEPLLAGTKNPSVYLIAKGLHRILEKYSLNPSDSGAQLFQQDFKNLFYLLKNSGFIGYPGNSLAAAQFKNDFLFEKEDYFQSFLKATREPFTVQGSQRYAVLEFTNVEQRLLAQNALETQVHEELLKWHDEFNSAQVSRDPSLKWLTPQPTRSPLLSNFLLSMRKYFRGDERKTLHWGLDLSGGKTVQVELRDQNNRVVKNEFDLNQGVNELYNRVNKMGVSEVDIRVVGSNIVLDFPGSHSLSAAELIKASSMYFHVINEKFSPENSSISDHISRFLQDVWNEAVVTNRMDSESINLLAYKHLYGETKEHPHPRSEAAKELYQQGLRLAHPKETQTSSAFDDTLSKIVLLRGKEPAEWLGHAHPLLIVFNNYALEGSSLKNVQASYDPSKGNFLSFEVKGSHSTSDSRKIYPQQDLYQWTSRFSKDSVRGTLQEAYSKGRGWRMAVVLNDSVISAPTLESAFKDQAMISGSFSHREVNQLVSDLKAGSLSFTPKILSEKNISPELGKQERTKGITASFIALAAVIFTMIAYYRFSGLVASVAVIFNLLFMWATLQNIQATLSLAGIAGIILTVGMAVDANVLVFERMREEFALSGKIATAVQAGYEKAFNAILDSNVTTIIAALILLHFDAGPIKAFAINLIIGIASSMFSALYMTKFFFMHWIKNPKHQMLKMANFVKGANFDFLSKRKLAFILTAVTLFVGAYCAFQNKESLFGMDFTGGYSLNISLKETPEKEYRRSVEKAFLSAGLSSQDYQIRELTPPHHLRILLSTQLENKGNPFHGLPLENSEKSLNFSYEANPRISWVVKTLASQSVELSEATLENLGASWTSVSGQMSDAMRNHAAIGLLLAMIAILIYLTFRFEFKFAISAMICLLHDVLMTLAAVALLNYLNFPIQIDLHTIAALMTIIGYSLNDTIIIFDRIREDISLMRKKSLTEIINHSLNITLSRTVMTSGTTLLVLLALIFFGGTTIFSFATVMAIGVVFGTLSSLFIASPILLFFERKEKKRKNFVEKPSLMREEN